MRRDLILQHLHSKKGLVTAIELESEFSISNRTLRNELKELKEIGMKMGFSIDKKRAEGYLLVIRDQEGFEKYFEGLKLGLAPELPRVRVNNVIMILLQATDFQTLDFLAEQLMVSRSTVLGDMSEVQKKIRVFNLKIESKPHFGIRLIGGETDFRRAFSFFINQKEMGLLKKISYQNFEENFPVDLMSEVLRQEIKKFNVKLSHFVLENILNHIQILSYRATQRNFILPNQEEKLDTSLIKPSFKVIADNICKKLSELYNVELPESEVIYLAAHLSGKSNADDIEEDERRELQEKIKRCLQRLDSVFFTKFSGDSLLLDALVLHMYPLLKRLYFNLTLSNPLIDDIYSRYSDVFMIAISFSEMIKEIWGFELSNDEMGYLTVHFATHMERDKQRQLSSFGRVLMVYDSGKGTASLQKMKLESILSGSIIEMKSYEEFIASQHEKYDLVISAVSIETVQVVSPCIKIAPILTDTDLQRIQKQLTKYPTTKVQDDSPSIMSLFRPELFYIEDEKDYIKLLKEKAEHVVELGLATENYPELVIEREKVISTIFQSGVAGPHSIRLVAIQDSISVVILKNPITYQGKVVQVIFLVNLSASDLYLYKDISRMIRQLIENPEAKQRILKVTDFSDFQYEISKILFT